MVLLREKETLHLAEWRAGRATLERGLFRRQYNAVRINDLSSLWPQDAFRKAVMELAKKYVQDWTAKGWRLLTPEADLLVYGPYQSRDMDAMRANGPGRMRVAGYQLGEDPYPDTADVVIRAEWLVPHPVEGRME